MILDRIRLLSISIVQNLVMRLTNYNKNKEQNFHKFFFFQEQTISPHFWPNKKLSVQWLFLWTNKVMNFEFNTNMECLTLIQGNTCVLNTFCNIDGDIGVQRRKLYKNNLICFFCFPKKLITFKFFELKFLPHFWP